MTTDRPSPLPAAPRGVPRLRRRIVTVAAAVALAVVAFLPGDSVFGDSTPSRASTVPGAAAPVR